MEVVAFFGALCSCAACYIKGLHNQRRFTTCCHFQTLLRLIYNRGFPVSSARSSASDGPWGAGQSQMQLLQLPAAGPADEEEGPSDMEMTPAVIQNDGRYSIVVSVSRWYEMAVQLSANIVDQPSICVAASSQPMMYAIPAGDALPQKLAPHVHRQGSQVYMCVHNPMTDCSLVELRALLTKAAMDVIVIVILPAAHLWDQDLQRAPVVRLHAHHESRYVATEADLYAWFTLMASGIFTKLVFILPYVESSPVESSQVWRVANMLLQCEILAGWGGMG